MGTLVVLLSILATILLVGLCCYLSVTNHTLYCFLFESRDFNLYRKLISIPLSHYHFDKEVGGGFYYIECDDYPNYCITLFNGESFMNEKGTLECYLTPFYERGTKKLYEKLIVLVEN